MEKWPITHMPCRYRDHRSLTIHEGATMPDGTIQKIARAEREYIVTPAGFDFPQLPVQMLTPLGCVHVSNPCLSFARRNVWGVSPQQGSGFGLGPSSNKSPYCSTAGVFQLTLSPPICASGSARCKSPEHQPL